MRFIAILLLTISFAVHSETENTSGIYYGVYTDHLFDDDVYNEDNDVLLLQHNDWYLGTFDNSFGKRSVVGAWSFWDYRKDWRSTKLFFQFDSAVGVATGYKDTPNWTILGLSPALIGSADIGLSHERFEYGVRTLYIPANVVNVGFFFSFKY